jgi:hypothetical protein
LIPPPGRAKRPRKCENARPIGEMAERFKAPVLKTGEGSNLPWVRIPLSPPDTQSAPERGRFAYLVERDGCRPRAGSTDSPGANPDSRTAGPGAQRRGEAHGCASQSRATDQASGAWPHGRTIPPLAVHSISVRYEFSKNCISPLAAPINDSPRREAFCVGCIAEVAEGTIGEH